MKYAGDEPRQGADCRKYVIDGAGLDQRGGAIWMDKQGEHFVDVEIDLPDNPNWESFKFALQKTERITPENWQKFLEQQLSISLKAF